MTKFTFPEPDLNGREAALQSAIVSFIHQDLNRAGIEHFVVEAFGLDVAVFSQGSLRTDVRFIELKVFAGGRPGGVGFGTQQGRGAQVDLLLRSDSELAKLSNLIRWVIADGTFREGDRRFAMITSVEAKAAAMAGVARGKQNNFRMSDLRKSPVDWSDLCARIHAFLA